MTNHPHEGFGRLEYSPAEMIKTAYCEVYDVRRWVENRAGVVQRCALKVAQREGGREAETLEEEYNRLRQLGDLGFAPGVVPTALAFGLHQGRTSLLMDWIDGEKLTRRISRGKPNPAAGAYTIDAVRRMVSLLARVHYPEGGLGITLPDFKRDALICTPRALRVLDWNVVGEYSEEGAQRDLHRATGFLAELACGQRLPSHAAAHEAVLGLSGSAGTVLARLLLEVMFALAASPAEPRQMLASYARLAELAHEYARALEVLEWARLGIPAAVELEPTVRTAIQSAFRGWRQAPNMLSPSPIPTLGLAPEELSYIPRKGLSSYGPGSTRPSKLDQLLALAVELGWIEQHEVRFVQGAGAGRTSGWDSLGPPPEAANGTAPTRQSPGVQHAGSRVRGEHVHVRQPKTYPQSVEERGASARGRQDQRDPDRSRDLEQYQGIQRRFQQQLPVHEYKDVLRTLHSRYCNDPQFKDVVTLLQASESPPWGNG